MYISIKEPSSPFSYLLFVAFFSRASDLPYLSLSLYICGCAHMHAAVCYDRVVRANKTSNPAATPLKPCVRARRWVCSSAECNSSVSFSTPQRPNPIRASAPLPRTPRTAQTTNWPSTSES